MSASAHKRRSGGRARGVALGQTPVIQTPKLGARIMRYELADHEWTAIKPMLPNKPRGVPRVSDRRVLNGIFSEEQSQRSDLLQPVFLPRTQ